MAKIYTKVGDKGETGLLGGQKVSKTHARIEAYGTIDELNSVLGLVRSELFHVIRDAVKGTPPGARNLDRLSELDAQVEQIQHWLFDLGSLLAAELQDHQKFLLSPVDPSQIKYLEEKIDGMTAVLKPLKEFILPGGSELASRFHIARTVCRRAERFIVSLNPSGQVPMNGIPFINRLSDYFFVAARAANHYLDVDDVVWKKKSDHSG